MLTSLHDILMTLPLGVYAKWALLALLLVIVAVWHIQQDKLYAHFSANPSARMFKDLQHTARNRSRQVMGVWVAALFIIIAGDMMHQNTLVVEATEPLMAVPIVPSPVAAPAPEAAAAQAALDATKPASAPVSPNPAGTHNPADPMSREDKLDDLKQRYEDILVGYYFLSRCERAFPQDLELINRALYEELRQTGGDETLHQGIFSAAKGSYDSVYADTPCDAKYLDHTLEQYHKMLNQLKQAIQ